MSIIKFIKFPQVLQVPRCAAVVMLGLAVAGGSNVALAQTLVDDSALALRPPAASAAPQQSAQQALLTRRGFWTYQWQPTSAWPKLQEGEIVGLNVRYFPDGSYTLSVQFAGPAGAPNGEQANNKGLWSVSPAMYASLITEGPAGPLPVPLPGLIARIKSMSADTMVLVPLQGKADMVMSFRSAN